jgi:hypothetical protein
MMRTEFTLTHLAVAVCLLGGTPFAGAQNASGTPVQPNEPPAAKATAPAQPSVPAKGKKDKGAYTGPTSVIVLPPTPLLDPEGKQRVDSDGNLMFNPPVKQIRDKKGHPVFDNDGKPVFQTATNLGYDEKGKKISVKKPKPPKMTPVSVVAGTLTVDGWTGKARLNYDIPDLKYVYIYAPGIGTAIVSRSSFPGAKEQAAAFNGQTLKVTVEGHSIEVWSEKRLLEKKPLSAWVAVDRTFMLPGKFPVFGYGALAVPPYGWPGSKLGTAYNGTVQAPPLPRELTPTLLPTPCPSGMTLPPGPPPSPGAPPRACVPIKAPAAPSSQPAPATH